MPQLQKEKVSKGNFVPSHPYQSSTEILTTPKVVKKAYTLFKPVANKVTAASLFLPKPTYRHQTPSALSPKLANRQQRRVALQYSISSQRPSGNSLFLPSLAASDHPLRKNYQFAMSVADFPEEARDVN